MYTVHTFTLKFEYQFIYRYEIMKANDFMGPFYKDMLKDAENDLEIYLSKSIVTYPKNYLSNDRYGNFT